MFIVLKCSLQCLATVEKYILDTYSLVNMNTHKKKKTNHETVSVNLDSFSLF